MHEPTEPKKKKSSNLSDNSIGKLFFSEASVVDNFFKNIQYETEDNSKLLDGVIAFD